MRFEPLNDDDRMLVEVAQECLRKNYVPGRHTSAAAVLCPSGRTYAGVNILTCGYGSCAEPVAFGAAISAGERSIVSIVVVSFRFNNYPIIAPCGNCRQLLVDYVPEAAVIMEDNGVLKKTSARSLLPGLRIVDEPY